MGVQLRAQKLWLHKVEGGMWAAETTIICIHSCLNPTFNTSAAPCAKDFTLSAGFLIYCRFQNSCNASNTFKKVANHDRNFHQEGCEFHWRCFPSGAVPDSQSKSSKLTKSAIIHVNWGSTGEISGAELSPYRPRFIGHILEQKLA